MIQANQQPVTANALPPVELCESLIENIGDIAMLPAVASEALRLTDDIDCTALQFSEVIKRDVSLATEMLTLANGAMFSGGRPISTLQQAIVRLGFNQCRNLIISSSTAALMRKMPLEQEWVREVIWTHSVTTATTCTLLNRSLALGFRGEEFTAGLLHDFGRLLLAIAAGDAFPLADSLDFQCEAETLEKEQAILGTDHCHFGAWFANQSGLPTCLVDVIRWHHEVEPPSENNRLIALVSAADHVSNHIQTAQGVDDYDPNSNRGLVELCEYTHSNVIEKFSAILPTLMEEVTASLN